MGKANKRSADPRRIALLRGINVGGKNKLPMKRLVEIFEQAGARNPRTYIQSGNVLFEGRRRGFEKAVEAALLEELGQAIPVVWREASDWPGICAAHPFLQRGEEKALAVGLLAEKPSAAQVAQLDPERSPGDFFQVQGREIYLWLPNGMARTKLTNAWFDRCLGTISTVRNLKTMRAIEALLDEE